MPTGVSTLAPFDCVSDKMHSPAFTIIHRDNFQTTLPILHMSQMIDDSDNEINNTNHLKNEKNHNFISQKRMCKSNDHLVLATLQNNQVNPLKKTKYCSRSHDNIRTNEKIKLDESIKSAMSLSTEDFTEILNAKLRRIQEKEELDSTKKGTKEKKKKPFITTVKTGEFLMPPPEVAALLGMAPDGAWIGNETVEHQAGIPQYRSKFRPLVALGRRPEVRHSSHNARCQAALKATVDFTVNIVNSTETATTLANEERVRRTCNNKFPTIAYTANVAKAVTQMPRLLPKKLQPIEGTVPIVMRSGDHRSVPFGNIMFDRRVIRGSTFATPMLLDGDHSPARRKQLAKKRSQQSASRSMMLRIRSPPPVPGRKHEPVQTEMYLEELNEKPDESEIGTQTDYILERPITPPYIPGKTGMDAETQIAPGDLFDYDTEVQPILEILVGKTIEQALIEVLEEEELAALREQQRRFLELRAAEKSEQQRLEAQERRIREEKDRRLKQHEEALKNRQETEERVAAAVLLTGYIAELLPAVLEGLKMSGFLLDEIKDDIEEGFLPWLMKEVKKEIGSVIESRELLMDIIREILENRAMTYKKLGEEYDASRELTVARFDPVDEAENDGAEKNLDFVNYESPDAL